MSSPLASLASTINNAFKSIFFDAVLTKNVVPSSPAYDPADPPAPVAVPFPCKAMRDNYSAFERQNSNILTGDTKVLILSGSLNGTPEEDDLISIKGVSYGSIVRVDVDPADAVWVLQCRR